MDSFIQKLNNFAARQNPKLSATLTVFFTRLPIVVAGAVLILIGTFIPLIGSLVVLVGLALIIYVLYEMYEAYEHAS